MEKQQAKACCFLRMNAVYGQMFSLHGHRKAVFVEENQKNITLNVQIIQFLIDNPPDSNYTIS